MNENIVDIYRLSPMQKGMLFHSLYSPQAGMYVVQFCARLEGELDLTAFGEAWQRVIERHPVLATSFHWNEADELLQVVHSGVSVPLTVHDYRAMSETEQAAAVTAFTDADQNTDFDLNAPPLSRINLLRLSDESYRLVWSFHHLLLDGWSMPQVLLEVFAFYEAAVAGDYGFDLPPARPFGDYIAWLEEQDMNAAESYWRQTLAGFSAPTPITLLRPLPPESAEPEIYDEAAYTFSPDLKAEIQAFCRRHRLTVNTLFQGAWSAVLSVYSGESDVVFGTTVSGRPTELPGADNIVGLFINTLPVRARLDNAANVADWLKALQTSQLDARQYEYSPLMEVQNWSELPRGTSLFDSLLVFENTPMSDNEPSADATLALTDIVFLQRTNYPLTAVVLPGSDFTLKMVYDTRRADYETAERILAHWRNAVLWLCRNPQAQPSHAVLLTDAERATLDSWNNAAVRNFGSVRTAVELFEEQVALRPEALAVSDTNTSLSYAELNVRVNKLARYLQVQGVTVETPVAICVERSVEMIVGIFAILKAGGAYIPLDADYPAERINFVLNDSRASLLLTQDALAERMPGGAPLFRLDSDWQTVEDYSPENPAIAAAPENLAYIIYTSGSTGQPKGVQIEHRALWNLLGWTKEDFGVNHTDRASQIAGTGFDVSVWEIFPYLTEGGSLFLPDAITRSSPAALQDWLIANRITCAFVPTPFAATFLDMDWSADSPLRLLHTGGDTLKRYPRAGLPFDFYNNYGPTENTVISTSGLVEPLAPGELRVSPPTIGKTLHNVRMYILDKNRQPVPIGVPGELYIGGAMVARGYLNRAELTAEKFVPDPFVPDSTAKMYKTGDLVRFVPGGDGDIEFMGRNDFQVKIRGFRIELGEIEAALAEHSAAGEVIVIAREDVPGQKRLVGYLTPKIGGSEVAPSVLQNYLKERLPDYMIPAAWVWLDAMPLTPNGKIDRRALPAPAVTETSEVVAPRSELEKILAEIWAGVLGKTGVGVHDNFFELGGDSILSIQVVARAGEAGLRLTPRQIFQHPTVAELAAALDDNSAAPATQVIAEQGAVTGEIPLTPIQHWFFGRSSGDPQHFNQAFMLAAERDLDVEVVQKAIAGLLVQHDSLRMIYANENGNVSQSCRATLEIGEILSVHDLTDVPDYAQADEIEFIANDLHRSLDIWNGNLVKVALFELEKGQNSRLLFIVHHLAVDGVSWRIVLEDFETLYRQIEAGEKPQLPAKTTSFQAWSKRLQEYANGDALAAELAYWTTNPTDEPRSLPRDFAVGDEQNSARSARTITVALDTTDTNALLQEVAAAYNTRIDDLLLTALAMTVEEWAGAGPLVLDMEGHGREELFDDMDISRTVGWFTALYPVTLELPGDGDMSASIKAIKEQLRRVPRKGVGYGLLRYLRPDSGLEAAKPAEISFNYLGQFDTLADSRRIFRPAGESVGEEVSRDGTRPYLLDVSGYVGQGKLQLHWTFSTALHKPATINKIAWRYVELLQALIGHCKQPGAGGFTPSDFSLVRLSQPEIDKLTAGGRSLVEDIYPLSPMQQGLLFHSVAAPGTGMYCEQLTWKLEGEMDTDAFGQAWEYIVNRHPILRTAFVWQGVAEPVQVVRPAVKLPIAEFDQRDMSPAEQEAWLEKFLQNELRTGFDLTAAPLMRLTLAHTGHNERRFIWSYHHLLLDGWSVATLFQEVIAAYEVFKNGVTPSQEKALPYRRYIAWLQAQSMSAAETFWRENLRGFVTPTRLPVEQGSVEGGQPDFAEHNLLLSESATAALGEIARRQRLTVNTIFQGAWALLLSRYTGANDVGFGITVAGRPADLAGVESIVGPFINTLPLRATFADQSASLSDWLTGLQAQQAAARQYDYTPLVHIQGWSEIERGSELFNTLLAFENYPVDQSVEEQGRRLKVGDIRQSERTNYGLNVVAIPGAALHVRFFYDRARFSPAVVTRLGEHLQTLLEAIAADPSRPVASYEILPDAERQQLLYALNATDAAYPVNSVHAQFEAQAARTPDAIALRFDGGYLTYAELNARANRLANVLIERGIAPGELVGVCAGRSFELIAGMIAILKAGGAYLPLDSNYPAERLGYMVEDAGVRFVLAQTELAGLLPTEGFTLVPLDGDLSGYSAQNPNVAVAPDSLAYVIYTSGSTGKPKGVCITHANILATILSPNYIEVTPEDVYLQFAPVCFDASTFEIWMPLLHGAKLAICAPGMPSLDELGRFIQTEGVTTLWATAGLFCQLVEEQLPRLSKVRQFLTGGDVVSVSHARKLLTELPGCILINGYGPTETTVFGTCYRISDPAQIGATVPIGYPIQNRRLYVLDAGLRPVPMGVPGELYIGGDGVGAGYLNRPELTAERFIADPFVNDGRAKMYKTGDLVRYLPDGLVEFMGRNDYQVKIRGFRIELGEIEAALAAYPGVAANCVVVREDAPGQKRLVGYVVPTKGENLAIGDLNGYLDEKLPEYMRPNAIVVIAALPLTDNGKVNRAALPAPERASLAGQGELVSPSTPTETALVTLWEDLLAVRPIGVTDNFFELGGHSLLALRLIAQVQKTFGQALSLAVLFEQPTVSHLAASLDALIASGTKRSPLVLLRAGSEPETPPFFCVHPGSGHVFCYRELAQRLDGRRAFYALEDPALWGETPFTRLEDMAASYLAAIRAVQPQGPYYLGGWSFGGLVAYEMARQLAAVGETTAQIILLDTGSPLLISQVFTREIDDTSLLTIVAKEFAGEAGPSLSDIFGALETRDRAGQFAYVVEQVRRYNAALPDVTDEWVQHLLTVFKARLLTIERYQPAGTYTGRLALFRAELTDEQTAEFSKLQAKRGKGLFEGISRALRTQIKFAGDNTHGWQKMVDGNVEVIATPGSHSTMLVAPHVGALATRLQAGLDLVNR
jgi:amino acid adenylation domain-containing protein/non-ribosomal peptide synthase protein (TIGR01720 family)